MKLNFSLFRSKPADARVARQKAAAGYLREHMSPVMFGWQAALRDPVDEVSEAWISATSKAIDALHNSGLLSGGVNRAVANIVGTGLQLQLTPEWRVLKWDEKATNAWARDVEARFNIWASNAFACDLGGRYSLHQMCAQGVRHWFGTGEIIAAVHLRPRVGLIHDTKINLLPSSRLSQTGNTWLRNPAERIVQGVVLDRDNMPIGYIFRQTPPGMLGAEQEVRVAARDRFGRPVVVHIFDGEPTQVRGITPLASALRVVRQIDQLQDATLTAALIQAIFAATIESDSPTEEILTALQSEEEQGEVDQNGIVVANPGGTAAAPSGAFSNWMRSRFQWYSKSNFNLGNFGKVVHTFPGEKLNFHSSKHPNSTYKEFMRALNREVATGLGITYEALTGDYEGSTYATSRMAEGHHAWAVTQYRREHIASPFMQAAFESWLEEDIEKGGTVLPGGMDLAGFIANRAAITKADWRGPPRPQPDEEKAAKANQIKLTNKVITRAAWAAEEGHDIEDVEAEEARENDRREELGLDPVAPPMPGQGGAGGGDPDAPDAGGSKDA